MNILSFFRAKAKTPPPAEQAKERLKIVLAHERSYAAAPDYLPRMQNEILQVIAKYVAIDQENLTLNIENSDNVSRLEVNIDLPKSATGLVVSALDVCRPSGATPAGATPAVAAEPTLAEPLVAEDRGEEDLEVGPAPQPLRQAASH